MKAIMPNELLNFSDILKELMKERKMTITDLAEELGCEYSTAQRYTSGKTIPDMIGFLELSKVFDVPVGYFISYEENKIKKWNEEGKFKMRRLIISPTDVNTILAEVSKAYLHIANKANAAKR